jgi:hypothetical protein
MRNLEMANYCGMPGIAAGLGLLFQASIHVDGRPTKLLLDGSMNSQALPPLPDQEKYNRWQF